MKIVVGVDGSAESKEALGFALDEAASLNAELVVLGVWRVPMFPLDGVVLGTGFSFPSLEAAVEARIGVLLSELHSPNHPEPLIVTASGSVGSSILDASGDADEIILGTRGHGRIAGAFAGSVTHQVAHHTTCPLIVVPSAENRKDGDADNVIVVGVDGSSQSIAALNWAAQRASHTGATVRPVLTWLDDYVEWLPGVVDSDLPSRDEMLEAAAKKDLAHAIDAAIIPDGVSVEPIERKGPTTAALRELSSNAAMLVVGARGSGGFAGLLLGSIASQCLRQVERPTVIVPSDQES